MNFICVVCEKVFSVKGGAALLMLEITDRVCSPECAAKLLAKEQK